MKNIMFRVIIIIGMIVMISMITMPKAYCSDAENDGGGHSPTSGVGGKSDYGSGQFFANDYKPSNPGDVVGGSKLLEKINIVLGWVNNIAIMASVLVLSIIGIKYMVGSVEEKAEYKKNMRPYLVGCVLAFGITTILKIISSIAQTLN